MHAVELAAHPLAGGRPSDDVVALARAAVVAAGQGAAEHAAAPADGAQRAAVGRGHRRRPATTGGHRQTEQVR